MEKLTLLLQQVDRINRRALRERIMNTQTINSEKYSSVSSRSERIAQVWRARIVTAEIHFQVYIKNISIVLRQT